MAPSAQRFPRRCRLTRGDEILRVRSEGVRQRTPWFEVRSLASAHGHPRVAIVVPRYRQTAVARNRVKRRLRELVRREWLPTLPPQDIVVRAAPAAFRATFDALRVSMLAVAGKLGMS